MAQRSPASSMAFSMNPSSGQTLVLIASDGVRVCVNRAIATEASYVLRDLLDGQDLVSSPVFNPDEPAGGFLSDAGGPSPPVATSGTSMTVHDLESLFDDPAPSPSHPSATAAPAKASVPDLMDFFAAAPDTAATTQSGTAHELVSTSMASSEPLSPPSARNAAAAPVDDVLASLWGPPPPPQQSAATSTTHVPALASQSSLPPLSAPPLAPAPPPPQPPSEVELPFPYFTGDILERVCRHMSYRFRMSSFGTEDGCYRVYLVKTRSIPRPMTLPLLEYLDMKDRRFLADWDEEITMQMVKAATLLNYEELLQLASAKLASYLIERDLEGVRTFLGVECDFDAAEDAELRKEQAPEFNR